MKKLIEDVKAAAGYSGKPQQWQYGFDLACRELAKAQAVPEWISVEDSVKPQDEQIVLVVRKDMINGLPIHDTAKYDEYGNVFDCYGRSETVSHWMPLPGLPDMIEAQELVNEAK